LNVKGSVPSSQNPTITSNSNKRSVSD
jgi:hypothetical protein